MFYLSDFQKKAEFFIQTRVHPKKFPEFVSEIKIVFYYIYIIKLYLFELKQINNTYKCIQYKLGSEQKPMAYEVHFLEIKIRNAKSKKLSFCFVHVHIPLFWRANYQNLTPILSGCCCSQFEAVKQE